LRANPNLARELHVSSVKLMYRISRVLETSSIAIVKLAGCIADSEVSAWSDFLDELRREKTRHVVLDFCEVSRMGRKAAETLIDLLPHNVLLLNCPIGIKNMISSAGYSSQLLESSEAFSDSQAQGGTLQ